MQASFTTYSIGYKATKRSRASLAPEHTTRTLSTRHSRNSVQGSSSLHSKPPFHQDPKHERRRPEPERSIESRRLAAGSAGRRLGITSGPGPKIPSSDTRNSLETDSAHANPAINELRPDSPATYSTTCSSSEHHNFRRSETERERREGISAEFDLCNNATHRGERFVRDCLCFQAIPSPGGLLRENGSDVFWRTAGYDLSIGGDQIASSAWGGATGTGDGGDGTNGFVGLVGEKVQFHVPEPATLSLFGLGLIAVGILGRRRGWNTRI